MLIKSAILILNITKAKSHYIKNVVLIKVGSTLLWQPKFNTFDISAINKSKNAFFIFLDLQVPKKVQLQIEVPCEDGEHMKKDYTQN